MDAYWADYEKFMADDSGRGSGISFEEFVALMQHEEAEEAAEFARELRWLLSEQPGFATDRHLRGWCRRRRDGNARGRTVW